MTVNRKYEVRKNGFQPYYSTAVRCHKGEQAELLFAKAKIL